MKVIVHCSDSSFGNAAIIDNWHRNRPKPFRMIGYHLVILNGHIDSRHHNSRFDGHVETGRPFDDNHVIDSSEWGAHTLGENDGIGICLIGKSGEFTENQLKTLMSELINLKTQFGEIKVYQHSDFDKRKPYCAGLSQEFMNNINEFIK